LRGGKKGLKKMGKKTAKMEEESAKLGRGPKEPPILGASKNKLHTTQTRTEKRRNSERESQTRERIGKRKGKDAVIREVKARERPSQLLLASKSRQRLPCKVRQ